MKREYTKSRDVDGKKIHVGDTLVGSYGIPPVRVEAKVIKEKGIFKIKTPDHNPKEVTVRQAVRYLSAHIG